MGVYQQPGVARAEVGVALTMECDAVMCSAGGDGLGIERLISRRQLK